MSSTTDWSRVGGVVIAFLALALAVAVLVPRFLGLAAGPEVEVITALKRTEREGLTLPLGGLPPLTSREHHYSRITVSVAPGGASAEAWATLDFEGVLGGTRVSSIGVERVPFARGRGGWAPLETAAPRLAAVVAALERRRRAIERADADALRALYDAEVDLSRETGVLLGLRHRAYTAEAWYIRIEREDAQVHERYRVTGDLPDRPVAHTGERLLELTRRGDEFFFLPGLM